MQQLREKMSPQVLEKVERSPCPQCGDHTVQALISAADNMELADDAEARIVCNPEILAGKPTIKGTRISVELVTDLLGGGSTRQEILEAYPHITADDIEACVRYKATGAPLSFFTWEEFEAFMEGRER